MADSSADLDDWELLLAPEEAEGEESRPVVGEAASDSEGDAIKVDYFDLDSVARYPNRVASSGNLQLFVTPSALVEDALNDLKLGNPRLDYCEFARKMKKETTLSGIECLQYDSQVYVEKEELVGAILAGDEGIVEEVGKIDLNLENPSQSEVEVKLPQIEPLRNDSEVCLYGQLSVGQQEEFGGSVVGDNFGGVVEEDKKVMEIGEVETDNCCEAVSEESVKADEKSSDALGVGDEDVSSSEKSRIVWWKLPMEFLKVCAFRMKPVWSISVVAALLGAFILTKKLYRMKQKTRTIPLKISFDKKNSSQLKIQATRLNEAFSVVRHVPVVRASLLANNGSSWPLVGFQ